MTDLTSDRSVIGIDLGWRSALRGGSGSLDLDIGQEVESFNAMCLAFDYTVYSRLAHANATPG